MQRFMHNATNWANPTMMGRNITSDYMQSGGSENFDTRYACTESQSPRPSLGLGTVMFIAVFVGSVVIT